MKATEHAAHAATVLVTGAGGGVGQGIIKALHMLRDERAAPRLDVRIVAADMSSWAAGLYSADVACLVPRVTDAGYVDAIIALCRRERVDYYLPGTDVELALCADNAARIKDACGAQVVVASPAAVRIADDKRETARFLEDHGLAHPRTFTKQEWAQAGAPLSLPVIVKPRVGCRSIGVEVVRSPAELSRALQRDDVIVQELIGTDDNEYTCTVVFWRGQPSDVVVLRRWLRAGDTYRVEPVRDEPIERYVLAVASQLGIEGSCNFQLRVHADGVPRLFEINARFSGTTPLCAEIGFNPVASWLLRERGVAYAPMVRTDVVVLRHWAELVVERAALRTLDVDKRIEPTAPGRTML